MRKPLEHVALSGPVIVAVAGTTERTAEPLMVWTIVNWAVCWLPVVSSVARSSAGCVAALALAQASLGPNAPDRHAGHIMAQKDVHSTVSFLYGFPRAGEYRIFVQVKRSGRVLTGVFDAQVG